MFCRPWPDNGRRSTRLLSESRACTRYASSGMPLRVIRELYVTLDRSETSLPLSNLGDSHFLYLEELVRIPRRLHIRAAQGNGVTESYPTWRSDSFRPASTNDH